MAQPRVMISNQWKVVLIVLIALVGAISAVVWRTQELLYQDKMSSTTDSSTKELAPLRRLVQDRLEDRKDELIRLASQRIGQGPRPGKNFGDFELISLVQTNDNRQWNTAWTEKSATVTSARWSNDYEQTLLKSLPYSKVRDGDVTWVRLSDMQGLPVYVMMVAVEMPSVSHANGTTTAEASGALPEGTDYGSGASTSGQKTILVGFMERNPLMDLTEDFIGSTKIVYIVDERGYVASHTNKSFLGALFSEDPLVQDIMHSRKSIGSRRYSDLENRTVIGHFEKIDRSNLFAVIETPTQLITGVIEAHEKMALWTGVIVGFVGLLLAWAVGRGMNAPSSGLVETARPMELDSMEEKATDLGVETAEKEESDVSAAVHPLVAHPVPLKSGQDKSVSLAVPEEFAEVFKEPILSILGQAQLIAAKESSSEVTVHTQSIEREARRATAIIERMMELKQAELPVAADEKMSLAEVIERTLEETRAELEADGITLRSEIESVPRVRGPADRMRKALAHLLVNAREAMAARTEKFLTLRLRDAGESLELSVIDTGVGMSRYVQNRAFDPFFKNFEAGERMGLGLSYVQRVLSAIGASCSFESSPGSGTVCTLRFQVTAEDRRAFVVEKTQKEIAGATSQLEQEAQRIQNAVVNQESEADDDIIFEFVETMSDTVPNTASKAKAMTEKGLMTSHIGDLSFIEDDEPRNPASFDSDDTSSVTVAATADDDDEVEEFSNVPLAVTMARTVLSPDGDVAVVVDTVESKESNEFQVKIRKPKTKG